VIVPPCSTTKNLLLPSFGISSPIGLVKPLARGLKARGGIVVEGVGVALGASRPAGVPPEPEPPPHATRQNNDRINRRKIAPRGAGALSGLHISKIPSRPTLRKWIKFRTFVPEMKDLLPGHIQRHLCRPGRSGSRLACGPYAFLNWPTRKRVDVRAIVEGGRDPAAAGGPSRLTPPRPINYIVVLFALAMAF